MSESLKRLERDIAETRERLSGTIDRIQDKLTVSGVVDEVLGAAAVPRFEGAYGKALAIVRGNPVPVLIVAAGLGWVLSRIAKREAEARAHLFEARLVDEVEIPVVNDGRARIYDPDFATDHPHAGPRGTLRGSGLNPVI